jgi:hypothetical protein
MFSALEAALSRRSPHLVSSLRPGLSKATIKAALHRAKVGGEIAGLLELYAWRNGASLDSGLTLEEGSLFPESVYQFLDLKSATEQFLELQAAAKSLGELTGDPTGLIKATKWAFPVFWDCATGYLASDLTPHRNNRVLMVEVQSTEPFRQAYDSLDSFVADVIRANRENNSLVCFAG